MDAQILIKNFRTRFTFTNDEILAIQTDRTLRADLVNHFRAKRDRTFALALLNKFIELRKDQTMKYQLTI